MVRYVTFRIPWFFYIWRILDNDIIAVKSVIYSYFSKHLFPLCQIFFRFSNRYTKIYWITHFSSLSLIWKIDQENLIIYNIHSEIDICSYYTIYILYYISNHSRHVFLYKFFPCLKMIYSQRYSVSRYGQYTGIMCTQCAHIVREYCMRTVISWAAYYNMLRILLNTVNCSADI